MPTTYTYRSQAAVGENGLLVASGSGQLFAITDTTFATPLLARDVSGANKTVIAVSGIGQTETFLIDDQPELWWKSGTHVVHLFSVSSMLDAINTSAASAAGSRTAAEIAAAAATATAQSVATFQKWIELGITRRNLVADPRATAFTGTSYGWNYQAGTGETGASTLVTGASDGPTLPDGTKITTYARRTVTAAKTAGASGWYFRSDVGSADLPVGRALAGGMYARISVPLATSFSVDARTGAAAGTPTLTSAVSVGTTWVRLTGADVADIAADGFQLWASHAAGAVLPIGATFDVTGAICEYTSTIGPYFDGSMLSTQYRANRWVSTVNASVSEQLDMTILTPDGLTADWGSITGKPTTFAPAPHSHDASAVTAGVFPPARLGSGTPSVGTYLGWDGTWSVPAGTGGGGGGSGIIGAPGTWPTSFPPASHSHPPTDLSGTSSIGRSLLSAVDAATIRGLVGAGTSSVTVGGAASGAAAPVAHTHPKADVGLSLVQNVAPADMPVSSAMAAELALKASAAHSHSQSGVANLVTDLAARIQAVPVVTGSEARPVGSSVVLWVGGSTTPTNMTSADIHLREV